MTTKRGAADAAPAVTNPDKVLFPDDGITKGDLVRYYQRVAQRILPYVKNRPLMLERYPDGIGRDGFFEKDAPRGAPEWVQTISLRAEYVKRTVRYVVCNDERTLTYLANLAAITFHGWQSRVTTIDDPDVLLIDLDPMPECPLRRIARVAVGVRDVLASVGLKARVKTTGGKGLHVIVPLRPESDYELARNFASELANVVGESFPEDVTLQRTISRRPKEAVYLDHHQIGRGKTFAVPFTVRARPSAPVSMPIDWEQVEEWTRSRVTEPVREFSRWRLETAADLKDPWDGSYGPPQRLAPALTRARREWRVE